MDRKVVAFFAAFQECIILELQVPGLQISLAASGFRSDQFGPGNGQNNLVHIGQLMTGAVDPVVIGIALENEAFRWR